MKILTAVLITAGVIASAFILALVGAAIGAVLLMFALGLIHDDLTAVPALGFVASFGSLLALGLVGTALRGSRNGK